LVAFAVNAIVAATPGYFNHDELLNLDTALSGDASRWTAMLFHRPLFFRPLGDGLQLALLYGFGGVPQVIHTFSVALTVLDAVLLARLLRALGAEERVAQAALVLYALSPLAVFGSGWIGVLYDQIYVAIILVLLHAALREPRRTRAARAAITFAIVVVGMLFKETVVVAPAALALLWWWRRREGRGYAIEIAAALLAIAVVLVPRLPVLFPSSREHFGYAGYSLMPSELPGHLLRYFLFPFFVLARESGAVMVQPLRFEVVVAAVAHVGLVVLLARANWRWAALYVCVYFLAIGPTLLLAKEETQYLYGASVPLTVALAYLLMMGPRVRRVVGAALAALAIAHAVRVQLHFFECGAIQRTLRATFTSWALSRSGRGDHIDQDVVLEAPPSIESVVARRYIVSLGGETDPVSVGGVRLRSIAVIAPRGAAPPGALRLRVFPDGSVAELAAAAETR
jgi:hypothetical protein